MKFDSIRCYPLINEVDPDKVSSLAQSMLANGWQGAPILVYGESLLTGSHRLAALRQIANDIDTCDADVLHQDVAEDVTDIVIAAIERRAEGLGVEPYDVSIDYDNIGWILEGTVYEMYKNDIREW